MKDIDDRLKEISKLCNYRLFDLADKKIDNLYEDYSRDRIKMNEAQEEWMLNLINRISTAIYG